MYTCVWFVAIFFVFCLSFELLIDVVLSREECNPKWMRSAEREEASGLAETMSLQTRSSSEPNTSSSSTFSSRLSLIHHSHYLFINIDSSKATQDTTTNNLPTHKRACRKRAKNTKMIITNSILSSSFLCSCILLLTSNFVNSQSIRERDIATQEQGGESCLWRWSITMTRFWL